jgi:NAD(P)-dependent dehydrogenase (short-subunit alcohol dehydrogenase family)
MPPTKIELRGAVVAVTGAARGIGRATAELFLQRGARVCLADLDGDVAADVAARLSPRAHPFQVDVASEESFAAFVASVEETVGPIDVLVNNAGVMPTGRFLDEKMATTEAVFGVNFAGPVNGMRLVLPGMTERGRGHIVNVASMLGRTELPGLASYTASKHAVVGLTAAVRRELGGTGVTLTVVLPSVVNTELASGITIPLARFARVEPREVAEAIVASCDSRAKELAVPRWMALYPMFRPFIPWPVEALARRLIGDDKALSAVDPSGRAAYVERLAKQVVGG